jgi:hypothetical protein
MIIRFKKKLFLHSIFILFKMLNNEIHQLLFCQFLKFVCFRLNCGWNVKCETLASAVLVLDNVYSKSELFDVLFNKHNHVETMIINNNMN